MRKRILAYRKSIDAFLDVHRDHSDIEKVIKQHLDQISFFQHERLVHLIVTMFFALFFLITFLILFISENLFSVVLLAVLAIVLVAYIRHYYLLENEVQKMYAQYDMLVKLSDENKK